MTKSVEMQSFLDRFAKEAFGISRTEAFNQKKCVTCGENVGEFRNTLSRREYGISGMYQKCQDSVFGVD